MHIITRAVLLSAANAGLLQNTSGTLAAHIPKALESVSERTGPFTDITMREVKLELKILGLLGSGNGGYIGEGLTIQRVGEEPIPFQTIGMPEPATMEVNVDGYKVFREIDSYERLGGRGPVVPHPALHEGERLSWTVSGDAIITTGVQE